MRKMLLLSLALSFVLFVAGSAVAGSDTSTVNGTVSDSMCGAKGANASHVDCMNKCMAKGAKAIIVTDGDQKVLTVDNPETLKGHEGHHVAVTGHVTDASVHVESVKML